MHYKTLILLSLVIAAGLLGWFLNESKNPENVETALETSDNSLVTQTEPVATNATDYISLRPAIAALPEQTLSPAERGGLIFMREEEKLARDVYSALYEKWQLPIFSNITQSEQTHTEAVRTLLTKYEIADPVTDDSLGEFTNTDLQTLYDQLTTQGMTSITEALTVGAIIEDLDIADLEKQIALTDNEDIKLVYENLLRGSRNHLRSFSSQLSSRDVAYTPQYITQSEFDSIITSAQEPGTSSRGWGKNR